MRVLLTGGTGFVGRAVCCVLAQSGVVVRVALRGERSLPHGVSESVVVGDISATTEWAHALDGVDAVIHAAARVHIMRDSTENQDLYAETNAVGTQRLARCAVEAGVGRFVFLSTVKVNGEVTTDRPYTAHDQPRPQDAYGISKMLGERHVREAAAGTSMQAIIVRLPLVYGPGVGANFLRLMRWVDRELPFPLAAVENRRSLVSIWNLCDFLSFVLRHSAAGGTWMVSDGHDVSTPDLIRRLGGAMHRNVRLLAVPPSLLVSLGRLLGKGDEVARLCGSLQIDITATLEGLGWVPPMALEDGLARTADWYLKEEADER